MRIAAAIYLAVVTVMSLVCFFTYGFRERQAARGGRRVRERTLHLMAFLGGWPGAYLGQRQFRHKTQKTSFRIVFWILLILHLALAAAVVYALVCADRELPECAFRGYQPEA